MSSDATALVQEIVTEELGLFTTLVVTDHEPLLFQLQERGSDDSLPDARVVVMPNLERPIAVVDKLALHAARAGKRIRTWCTATDTGRRIAVEVARSLNPAMGSERVLHIAVPPDRWQPELNPFESLVETARPTAPVSPTSGTNPTAEPQPPFDTSPAEVTRRIILRFGGELVVVAPSQSKQELDQDSPSDKVLYSTGYALGDNGIWQAGGDIWARWLIETAEMMHQDAASFLRGKPLTAAQTAIDRIKRPGMVKEVRPMLRAVLDLLRSDGNRCSDVTECDAEDLNANPRYLGTKSGVVDLETGSILSPEEGRRALVTIMAPTEFDPAARHPIVDDLLGRMSPERRGHFMGALGNALRSTPKRLYAVVCEPDCGKTTYHNLIVNTLGPVYAKIAGVNVIQDRRNAKTSDTQLTPGLTAWWAPTRIILMDEVKETSLSPELVKDLTGGGKLTARGLRKDLQTKPVTATTFMLSNEETVPRLRLDDSGLRARYRELRLPHIPDEERDEGYIRNEASQLPEVRAAFLAVLVAAAKENPEPPEDTPEVKEITTRRIEQDAGELGRFARRLVRDGEGRLSFADMWAAWCQANSEITDAKAPGGIGKRIIVRRLRAYVPELPDPTTVRIENRNVRGWRGWRLLTMEEAENESVAQQVITDLLDAIRKWDDDQIEALLWRLAEGNIIIEDEASVIIGAPAYSYMMQKKKRSVAFEQAYKRLLPMRVTEKSTIDTEIAIMLAEKYLVRADHELRGDATADDLAFEASRHMVAAMATASDKFTPVAQLLTNELEGIIQRVCGLDTRPPGRLRSGAADCDTVSSGDPPDDSG